MMEGNLLGGQKDMNQGPRKRPKRGSKSFGCHVSGVWWRLWSLENPV